MQFIETETEGRVALGAGTLYGAINTLQKKNGLNLLNWSMGKMRFRPWASIAEKFSTSPGAHTGIEAMAYNANNVPCMANQLSERYGDTVNSEDFSWLAKDIEPSRVDAITIMGKEYAASYYGKEDLTGFKDFTYREFWRLENAYDDFKDNPKTGDVLPYGNYPMLIETGQIFVIDYAKTDGSVTRMYYRSDGYIWEGVPSTEEFNLE